MLPSPKKRQQEEAFCLENSVFTDSTFISLLIKAYATSKFMCLNTYRNQQILLRKYSYGNIKGQITLFKNLF